MTRYPLIARVLHWTVAAAVLAQWTIGWSAEHIADRQAGGRLIAIHYQLGMTILALTMLRVSWRAAKSPLPLEHALPMARAARRSVHLGLYALLFVLPASGYVIWVWMGASMDVAGVVSLPRLFAPGEDETSRAVAWYVHFYSSRVLALLVAVHVAAALWHELVLQDGLISRRML